MDEWLTRSARDHPDRTALVAGGESLTYAALAERVEARPAGGTVHTDLAPGLEFAELLLASGTFIPRAPGSVPRTIERTREARVVVFTAGTTGEPKPVELTRGNLEASAAGVRDVLGAGDDERWLCVLPTHHVGGLSILVRSVIWGTTAILHPRFDLDAVAAERDYTLLSLVPTQLRRLLDAGWSPPRGLRAVVLGGGPIPPGMLEAAPYAIPTYGMTETASMVWAGRPLPGAEFETAGDGELLVRGPMVSPGALSDDGWLHTGDRGRLEPDGALVIEGRLKDFVVTGGENVSCLEVERALLAHPAVEDAGVVGVPDAEWGEAVTAFVVLREPVSMDELAAHARGRLEPFKVPKRIEQVPGLPRNEAGKLLRSEIIPGP